MTEYPEDPATEGPWNEPVRNPSNRQLDAAAMSRKMIDGAMIKEYLLDLAADVASFVEQLDV